MEYAAGEVIVVTPCEHVFHKRCCHEWLQHSRTCPNCRTDVPEALGMNETSTLGEQDDRHDSAPAAGRGGHISDPREHRNRGREEFRREISNLVHFLRRRRDANNVSPVDPQVVTVIELPAHGALGEDGGLDSLERDGSSNDNDVEQSAPRFEV